MSNQNSGLYFRELATLTEMKHAEEFQQVVWGEDDKPDNADILLAIQHAGGLVAGAFQHNRMLGFLFGFPTNQPNVQHSHRLAVHPDNRGMGIGARLKWFQRDWCLQRDISRVCWTYDPLLRVNAALNIEQLGATACIYHENYYGEMEGINAGAPSDRLLAEWQLDSQWVTRKKKSVESMPAIDAENKHCVFIPPDFTTLLSEEPAVAVSERLRVRDELQTAFAQNYRIVGFDKRACRYLLSLAKQ